MNKLLRADIYAQLSEFLKEPTEEFADDVSSGRLLNFFIEAFSQIGLDTSLTAGFSPSTISVRGELSGDAYTILKDEYRKLFTIPIPPYIVPVESVYKRWTSDPTCDLPIADEKGYLMGDPAIDMIKRYQSEGLVIPDKYSSMPDHIALELEYMSFFMQKCLKRKTERISGKPSRLDRQPFRRYSEK